MLLQDKIIQEGNWLFRNRSYLPLFLIPLAVIVLSENDMVDFTLSNNYLWEFFSLAVSLFGFLIRCMIAGFVPEGTSGRNTRCGQIANSLNTSGLYSVVRNPLYLGNFFIILGFSMLLAHIWFCVVCCLLFWLYYERIIMAEESFLLKKFGSRYQEYAKETPVFIPRLKNWRPPELSFSLRTVLRREYCGLYLIFACFFGISVAVRGLVSQRIVVDPVWFSFFCVAGLIFLILRVLKKQTTLLNEKGR